MSLLLQVSGRGALSGIACRYGAQRDSAPSAVSAMRATASAMRSSIPREASCGAKRQVRRVRQEALKMRAMTVPQGRLSLAMTDTEKAEGVVEEEEGGLLVVSTEAEGRQCMPHTRITESSTAGIRHWYGLNDMT